MPSQIRHSPNQIERVTYRSNRFFSLPSSTDQNSVFSTDLKTGIQDIATRFGFKIETPGTKPLYKFNTDTELDMCIINEIFDMYSIVDPLYEDETDLVEALQIGDIWKERLKESRKKQLTYIRQGDKQSYHQMVNKMFIGRDMNELLDSTVTPAWKHSGIGRLFNVVSHNVINHMKTFERVTGLPPKELVTNDDWSLWGLKTQNGIINGFEPAHGLHAWEILNLLRVQSVPNNPGIIELGGGIGSIAEKLFQWSDQPFTIFLIDLPLNITTAYAYLARILGPDNVRLICKESELTSLDIHEKSKQVVLLPTLYIERLLETQSYEVVHNSASLSEMETSIIEWYLKKLLNGEPSFFIETNTNLDGKKFETPSRKFPVPGLYDLLGRFEANEKGNKYCTSLYQKQE